MTRMLRTAHDAQHRPLPSLDLDHALAVASVVMGAVGLLLLALGQAGGAVWLGAVGMAVALWAQMVSRTRGERFVDMAGLLLCFAALAAGAARGGLS